jgi:hypothetical protein
VAPPNHVGHGRIARVVLRELLGTSTLEQKGVVLTDSAAA